jgi:23S rRNA pseudouridine1911/1915/1917 synthase
MKRTSPLGAPSEPTPGATLLDCTVAGDLAGQRLDRAVAGLLPGLSRTRAQAAIEAGHVSVNGRVARSSLLLEPGMRVVVQAPTASDAPPAPPDQETHRPLRIVYEDGAMLVVDKPAGVVVHPAPGHPAGTLVDALLAHAPGLHGGDDASRPGIVHRLDKDTSGLLVVAKNASAHANLAAQMQAHSMIKRYLALVEGQMPVPEGVIDASIGRDPRHRQRMALVSEHSGGRDARTRFRVLETGKGRSLLELTLETGRTHQIRVHLAAVQHPVVGDPLYGRPQPPLPPRQFLHAAHLELAHPLTGEWMTFEAPLPADLAPFLAEWEG